jgi:hypothetical protein
VTAKRTEKRTPTAPAACPACYLVVAPAAAQVMTTTGTYHRECYEVERSRSSMSRPMSRAT